MALNVKDEDDGSRASHGHLCNRDKEMLMLLLVDSKQGVEARP